MVCAIILAAGRSQRMGTSKALLPFGGSTIIARVVDAFLDGGANHVLAVVRHGDQLVRSALAGRSLAWVENPDPEGDMLSSLRCGLRATPPGTRLIAVSPVDQPSLNAALIRHLLRAFASCGHPILVPVHQGVRGHPVLFASRFRDELLTAFDGIGLRGLLRAHPDEISEWETTDAAVSEDIDTPDDYQARTGRIIAK
jgi:CTP:molybdopterin cytidylyltransferase MocA